MKVSERIGWQVHGDFWNHEYEITKDGQTIAMVSKEWLTWGDTYEIRVGAWVDEIQYEVYMGRRRSTL